MIKANNNMILNNQDKILDITALINSSAPFEIIIRNVVSN